MSRLSFNSAKQCVVMALAGLLLAGMALSTTAEARGIGHSVNGARYYGPVYGWRYSPPPARVAEPACTWASVRVWRNGRATMRRVRRCS